MSRGEIFKDVSDEYPEPLSLEEIRAAYQEIQVATGGKFPLTIDEYVERQVARGIGANVTEIASLPNDEGTSEAA